MMNLEDTMHLWQQQTLFTDVQHLRRRDLRELADRDEDDPVFDHLALCTRCRQRLWRLQHVEGTESFDRLVLHAADVGSPQDALPQGASWETLDRKYKIELRPVVGNPHRAILIVNVKSSHHFEGKTLVVEDAYGRELLRGTIDSDGLVAAAIEDIRTIALEELVISEE